MNDLSGVGIAALLLALLPLVQTCFRMVRLRCSPANGARGDQQPRRRLDGYCRPVGELSRFQPDLRTSSDKRRVLTFGRIFLPTGSGAYRPGVLARAESRRDCRAERGPRVKIPKIVKRTRHSADRGPAIPKGVSAPHRRVLQTVATTPRALAHNQWTGLLHLP